MFPSTINCLFPLCGMFECVFTFVFKLGFIFGGCMCLTCCLDCLLVLCLRFD